MQTKLVGTCITNHFRAFFPNRTKQCDGSPTDLIKLTTRLAAEQSLQDVVEDLGVYISGDRRRRWSTQIDRKQHREGENGSLGLFCIPNRSASAIQDSTINAGVLLPSVEPYIYIGEIQKLRGKF